MILGGEDAAIKKKADEEKSRAAQQEEIKRHQAEKAKRDAQKLAELRAEVEQRKRDREYAAYSRLVDACVELYEDDEVEAITNAMCFDVFKVRGLPD